METEPQHDDRQERDLGHGKADRDDRIEEPTHRGKARDHDAERGAGDRGDREADQRAVERRAEMQEELAGAGVDGDALEHDGERRQHEGRDRAAGGQTLPGCQQCHDQARPRHRAENQVRHSSTRRIAC